MNLENPYEAPGEIRDEDSYRARRISVAVVLGILTIPATGLVFVVTCFSSGLLLVPFEGPSFNPYALAFLIGIVSAGSTVYMMVRMIHGTLRRPPTDLRRDRGR